MSPRSMFVAIVATLAAHCSDPSLATERSPEVARSTPSWSAGKPIDFMTSSPANPNRVTHGTKPARAEKLAAPIAAPAGIQAGTITNLPICTDGFEQSPPHMVSDGAGGSFVVWHDYRNGDLDIYAQRLNAAGSPVWTLNGVPVAKPAGFQLYPRIAPDGTGGAIVVWQDARTDSAFDVYAQRLNSAGTPVWGIDGVLLSAATGAQRLPDLVSDAAGGAIVAWIDMQAGSADIYAQRVNAAGLPQWAAGGVPICDLVGTQDNIAIVEDHQGGAILSWRDERAGSSDLYAQRIGPGGAQLWTAQGATVCVTGGAAHSPVMVADGIGGAILAWQDGRGADFDIYVQRLDAAGVLQWPAAGVTLCGAPGDQQFPHISSDLVGGAVVVWQDARGANLDIYAMRVAGGGTPSPGWTLDGTALCLATGDQTNPDIATDPSGAVVTSWSDLRTPADGRNIYGQRVALGGAVSWIANGVLLSDGVGDQEWPEVIAFGNGAAAAAWLDRRSGGADIYCQRVDASGAVTSPCITPVNLSTSSVVTASAVQSFYQFDQAEFYWTGVAVRPSVGTDWDLETYSPGTFGLAPFPECFTLPTAGSYGFSGVDLIISNHNIGGTPLDVYGVRVNRYSGAGTAAVEWDDADNLVSRDCTGGNCGAKSGNSWTGVLDVHDVFLFDGTTYTFDFTKTGSADIRFLFYAPGGGGATFLPRSAAEFETSTRYTVYTTPTYSPPRNPPGDFYGMVLTNENGVAGTYTVKVITGVATVGVGDGPESGTRLQGVVPNPAQGQADIRFLLREPGEVGFRVLDMAGRVVSIVPPQRRGAGPGSVRWEGRDGGGATLGSGVYFVQMFVNGERVGTSRMALVR